MLETVRVDPEAIHLNGSPPPLPPASVAQESTLEPLVERSCPVAPSADGQVYVIPPRVVEAEAVKLPVTIW